MPAAASPKARRTAAPRPELRLRMRVTVGEAIAVGPGKVALLEAVDEHRSISAAAKALGMSYRRAWLLMDELNRSLKSPAVTTATGGANGGGSELTEVGRRLIQLSLQSLNLGHIVLRIIEAVILHRVGAVIVLQRHLEPAAARGERG